MDIQQLLDHNLGKASLIMEESKNAHSKVWDLIDQLSLIDGPKFSDEELSNKFKEIATSLFDINAYSGNIWHSIKQFNMDESIKEQNKILQSRSK
jgi:hypothetical protein